MQQPDASANALGDETSPYLIQHAHNPVDWYPWGPEAFARAKAENKAIFLSIGYSTCHWCHVMERESFEDEDIARLMNEYFVCIKIDRERRPDVDEFYMTAVHVLGQRGGWPMSSFLTPDGEPFFGGTYFPPPRFTDLLHRVHTAWNGQRDQLIGARGFQKGGEQDGDQQERQDPEKGVEREDEGGPGLLRHDDDQHQKE